MMKKIIISTLTIFLFISCKKEPKLEYKYADKEDLFECSSVDMKLIKEAVYAFEDFIKNNYSFQSSLSVSLGYTNFLNNTEVGYLPLAEKIDSSMKEVIYKLKDQKNLWNKSENKTTLNYKSNLIECILSEMQNQEIKTILTSMIKSNTLRSNILAPAVNNNVNQFKKDRALATFIALDMFYAKVFNIDLSLSPEEISKQLSKINRKKVGHVH